MFRLLKKMPWPETQTHKCKQTSARLNDRLSCSHVPCFETVPANVLQREGTGKSRSIRTSTEYVATHPLHDAQLALHCGPKKKIQWHPPKKTRAKTIDIHQSKHSTCITWRYKAFQTLSKLRPQHFAQRVSLLPEARHEAARALGKQGNHQACRLCLVLKEVICLKKMIQPRSLT